MTSTESEALDCVARYRGRLHYYLIAEDLRISAHYAYIICKGLEKDGYVTFDAVKDKGICTLTDKGGDKVQKAWFLRHKIEKENIKKNIKKNKDKISRNVETIKY